MRAHRAISVAVVLIAATSACSGEMGFHRIGSARVSPQTDPAGPQITALRIEPGVTTHQQVRVWFGEPDAVRVDNLGAAEWGYARDLRDGRIQRAIEQIDRWVVRPLDRFLNEVVFYPPRSTSVSTEPADRLSISFGPDGVVTQFAYRRKP